MKKPLFSTVVAAVLGGCSSPWSSHYQGARLNALEPVAPVNLVASRASEVERGERKGYVLLGRSEFEQGEDAGEGSLEDFARTIGAPLVMFSIEDKGERKRTVRKAQYVPAGASGGSYVDADGAVRSIDSGTNSYVYMDVEREITEHLWKHAAAFFAPLGAEK